MTVQHNYSVTIEWTGNRGQGTTGYRDYDRNHTLSIQNKPDILCSSDTAFRGDATRHNPEDMLVAALSSCHMLWYLHLCADAGGLSVAYHAKPAVRAQARVSIESGGLDRLLELVRT